METWCLGFSKGERMTEDPDEKKEPKEKEPPKGGLIDQILDEWGAENVVIFEM